MDNELDALLSSLLDVPLTHAPPSQPSQPQQYDVDNTFDELLQSLTLKDTPSQAPQPQQPSRPQQPFSAPQKATVIQPQRAVASPSSPPAPIPQESEAAPVPFSLDSMDDELDAMLREMTGGSSDEIPKPQTATTINTLADQPQRAVPLASAPAVNSGLDTSAKKQESLSAATARASARLSQMPKTESLAELVGILDALDSQDAQPLLPQSTAFPRQGQPPTQPQPQRAQFGQQPTQPQAQPQRAQYAQVVQAQTQPQSQPQRTQFGQQQVQPQRAQFGQQPTQPQSPIGQPQRAQFVQPNQFQGQSQSQPQPQPQPQPQRAQFLGNSQSQIQPQPQRAQPFQPQQAQAQPQRAQFVQPNQCQGQPQPQRAQIIQPTQTQTQPQPQPQPQRAQYLGNPQSQTQPQPQRAQYVGQVPQQQQSLYGQASVPQYATQYPTSQQPQPSAPLILRAPAMSSTGSEPIHGFAAYADAATNYQSYTYSLPQNAMEMELIREINNLRRDPQSFARKLERERKPYYADKIYCQPGDAKLLTKEGVIACDDAIRYLMQAQPLPELELEFGLIIAAKATVREHAPRGSTTGNSMTKINEYGQLLGEASELSKYGARTGKEILMSWVISDGDPSRMHRKIFFDSKWKKMGVATGQHNSVYKTMAIVNLATAYDTSPQVAQNVDAHKYLWEGEI